MIIEVENEEEEEEEKNLVSRMTENSVVRTLQNWEQKGDVKE